MTDRPEPHDELHRGVETHRDRQERWRRNGERPLARNLAMIGSLGWLIVTPMLAGMFSGRWLDRTFEMGLFWTSGLLFLGLVVGCVLAWKRIHED